MNFRFVHTADLHLDSPFKGIGSQLPKALQSRVRDSTFRAFDRVVQLCIDEGADFLVIAGDVYDLADRSLRAQTYFQKKMMQLHEHGIRVYVCHGNHDPEDGQKLKLEWPDNVYFFSAERVEGVPFQKNGEEVARLYGRSYPTAVFKERIIEQYEREEGVPFAIGVLHTNLDGHSEHADYAPSTKRELFDKGFDYWALGHVHQGGIINDRHPCIVYAGNPQGRHIKEQGPKGCYLVDVHGGEVTRVIFCETDDVRWYETDVDLAGVEDMQGVLDKMLDVLQVITDQSHGRATIVRLNLIGETEVHAQLKPQDQLIELLDPYIDDWVSRESWLFIESIRILTRPAISRETLLEGHHFLGDLLRSVQQTSSDPVALTQLKEQVLHDVFDHREVRRYLPPLSHKDVDQLLHEAEDLLVRLFVHTLQTDGTRD